MRNLEFGLLVVLMLCVLYEVSRARREIARVRCEFDGHWPAVFKQYDDVGHCPRCRQEIATRPPEAPDDCAGMQLGPDTMNQRIERIETALGIAQD